jgi:hypothetical protein
MFKASVPRLQWSEMDVLCMCIICISVCIPNCCCMSASHKSTWGCYSSYSYRNYSFAFLFLIQRLFFTYTKCKVESCAPLGLAWRNRLTTFVFWLFFPSTTIILCHFLLFFVCLSVFLSLFLLFVAFLSSLILCPILFYFFTRNSVFRIIKINLFTCKLRCFKLLCIFMERGFVLRRKDLTGACRQCSGGYMYPRRMT